MRKINFVLQGSVLLVGFYFQGLVTILGDLLLQVLDGGFVFAAGGIVGFDGSLGLFQDGLGPGKLLLDCHDPLGQLGDFFVQAKDFPVGFL